jgi:hypothetical protein
MPIREATIQKQLVDYLDAVLLPSHRVFAVPNGSRRTASGRAANGVPGLRNGVTDLAIVGLGKVYMVEVKAPHGTLSDAQEEWRDWCMTRGLVPWACVRSLDDLIAALSHWGIPTRAAS